MPNEEDGGGGILGGMKTPTLPRPECGGVEDDDECAREIATSPPNIKLQITQSTVTVIRKVFGESSTREVEGHRRKHPNIKYIHSLSNLSECGECDMIQR